MLGLGFDNGLGLGLMGSRFTKNCLGLGLGLDSGLRFPINNNIWRHLYE